MARFVGSDKCRVCTYITGCAVSDNIYCPIEEAEPTMNSIEIPDSNPEEVKEASKKIGSYLEDFYNSIVANKIVFME